MKRIPILFLILSVCLYTNIQANKLRIPTITVTKQNIADSKQYYGTLTADESRIYSISMRIDGFVENLFVTANYTKVAKNDALFAMYSPELVDAQSEFLATYNHSHLAKQKLELLGVSNKEIARLQKNRKILNKVTFYAPSDGIIFVKNINIGSGIKKGDEVLRIINIDSLWVLANINQEDLAFITQGNHKAYVSIEGFHEKIPLQFDRIYPEITDSFVRARFILSNPKHTFFPNMFAYITIESDAKSRLTLPKHAVLLKNNKYFVFIEDDGEFLPQEIQARRILGTSLYEIIDGLQEGDRVAKNALFILDSDAQNNGDF